MQNKNNGLKYKCDICDKIYSYKEIKFGESEIKQISPNGEVAAGSKYLCPECGNRVESIKDLTN